MKDKFIEYKLELILFCLFFFGAMHPVLSYLSVILIIIFSFYIVRLLRGSFLEYKRVPSLVVFLLLFQNVGIAFGSKSIGNHSTSLSLLTQLPTIFITIIGVYFFIISVKNGPEKTDIIFIALGLIVLLYFLISKGGIVAKLSYSRNFLIFYFGLLIGRFTLHTRNNFMYFSRYVIVLAFTASVIGIVSIPFGQEWNYIFGSREVYIAKRNMPYSDTLPANFTTVFAGHRVNRIASFYYDPVNFSYFVAFSIIITYFYGSKIKSRLIKPVLIFALIFTFGKGGQFIAITTLISYIVYKGFRKAKFESNKAFIYTLLLFSLTLALLVFIIEVYFPNSFGTKMHFFGIKSALELSIRKPFGHGLASAGNIVEIGSEIKDYVATETALFNMLYQVGFLPVVLLISIYIDITKNITHDIKKNWRNIVVGFLPFILLIVSTFQENAFTPQCVVPFMLLIGAFIRSPEVERGIGNHEK